MPHHAAGDAEGLDGTVREEHAGASGRVLHVAWEGGGRVVPLRDGQRIVLGRGADCDIVIPLQFVSRRHAVVVGGAVPIIEDLGSSNGTLAGGRLLRARESAALAHGVVARIGGAVLVTDGAARPDDPLASGEWVVGAGLEAVLALASRYAVGSLSVLVTGETGVGKERIAEYVHERSTRAGKPLLRINCAALPEALLESELFGHERGAFTGATGTKRGLLESAEGGTVFLDEVGEMPLLVQAKMLRAVEAQEVLRVGSLRPLPIDVRFVAATNRDLGAMAADGRFRSDLFYRLGGGTLHVPPLRERRDEIVPLAEAFLRRARHAVGRGPALLSDEAKSALLAWTWPGNVRELRNVIERAVLLCDGDSLERGHLHLPSPNLFPSPTLLRSTVGTDDVVALTAAPTVSSTEVDARVGSLRSSVEAEELRHIREALASAAGNQTRAANLLGISRQTLLRRLDKYGIMRPRK